MEQNKKMSTHKKKCENCPDRFRPDGYICENECPYDENGKLKKVCNNDKT